MTDPVLTPISSPSARPVGSAWEVFTTALRLGGSSFGGPIAHLGYFERVYVRERRWLDAHEYAEIVALCQLLPGPASSQTGFLIGWRRAGVAGALAAFLGFTLPSVLLMVGAAWLAPHEPSPLFAAMVRGLQWVAVIVVAQAVWSMAQRLCPDALRRWIAVLALAAGLLVPGAAGQWASLLIGTLVGLLFCEAPTRPTLHWAVSRPVAVSALVLYSGLLIASLFAASQAQTGVVPFAAAFYRAGGLVFGGGHVVLPLLHDALVPTGYMDDGTFLAGYGMAQALPGPLFAFAGYLGASAHAVAAPWLLVLAALGGIFLPGLLITVAGAGLFQELNRFPSLSKAITGLNAAVVGVLATALYNPVWVTAVHGVSDVIVVGLGLVALERWRVPPIVLVGACIGVSLGWMQFHP